MIKKLLNIIRSNYLDDEYRQKLLFLILNLLLATVSFVMTVVNLITREYVLMVVTALFSVLCIINVLFVKSDRINNRVAYIAFSVESLFLLSYFVISGNPDGFSVLWTLLSPAFAFVIFGKRHGLVFSIVTFCMVIFFFWVPLGRSLLAYNYNETFMLRFPFVFICMLLTAWYLEIIRFGTYTRVKDAEEQARYLYRHDALTGIFTRHAFSEKVHDVFDEVRNAPISAIMLDLDDFKIVNDKYGHNAGDEVIKTVARIVSENTCKDCIYCRFGGEEFLILMKCHHDPYAIAEQIRRIAENTSVFYEDKDIHITLSLGVATAKNLREEQLEEFINCADKAMYNSKSLGKNKTTVTAYEPKNK